MDETVTLNANASLVGKDLTNVYRHFKSAILKNNGELPNDLPNARFKKKEDLDSTAKSLIKHKIKQLTGQSGQDVEQALGYSTQDGAGIPVEELRKVARLMILEASDKLPEIADPEVVKNGSNGGADAGKKKKTKVAVEATVTPSTPTRRATRKSLAPEILRKDDKVDCRLKPEAKKEEEAVIKDEELGLGPNPTAQMVARKRRSIAVLNNSTVGGGSKPTRRSSPVKPRQDDKMVPAAPKPGASNRIEIPQRSSVTKTVPVVEEDSEQEMEVEVEPVPSSKKRKRSAGGANAAQATQASQAVEAARTAAKALNATADAIAEMAANNGTTNDEEQEEMEPVPKSAKRGSLGKPTAAAAVSRAAVATASPAKKTPSRKPRKSMLMSAVETLENILMPVPQSEPEPEPESEPEPEPEPRPLQLGFTGEQGCRIFIGQSQLTTFKAETFKSKVKDFPGANMVVLHTPVTWDPTDVFSLVMAVRAMNRTCQMATYTVLVGCGLSNVHLLREALYRQTKHVQFLVFERKDADLNHAKGKLRDVNSYFLLAYFFEGCEQDPSTHVVEVPAMVRPGATTSFRTESVEDLENQIVHTFTEKTDWILDLFCDDRELSLAAQKSGRNAIAVHNRAEPLMRLKSKAAAIARHFDSDFDPTQDGIVMQF